MSSLQKQKHPSREIGKKLPSSIEAERAVLSALLLNEKYLEQVAEVLYSSDFHFKLHQVIFQAILELYHQKKHIDLITLQDQLSKENNLNDIGGIEYLIALQEDIPALGLIDQHVKIIKEKAI